MKKALWYRDKVWDHYFRSTRAVDAARDALTLSFNAQGFKKFSGCFDVAERELEAALRDVREARARLEEVRRAREASAA